MGAQAGKVLGTGGGGIMMFIVDPKCCLQVIIVLLNLEERLMDFSFTKNGALAW